jgi:hypothetical protein
MKPRPRGFLLGTGVIGSTIIPVSYFVDGLDLGILRFDRKILSWIDSTLIAASLVARWNPTATRTQV